MGATFAYVACNGSTDSAPSVAVIDCETNQVVHTVALGAASPLNGYNLLQVATAPDGSQAYVVINSANRLVVIDTANFETTTTTVSTAPYSNPSVLVGGGIAIRADGFQGYVTGLNPGYLTVVNINPSEFGVPNQAAAVAREIALQYQGYGVALTPDGGQIYVAMVASVTASQTGVAVIDLAANSPPKLISAPGLPSDAEFLAVAVAPNGTVYVTEYTFGSVWVIDPATQAFDEAATIKVGNGPKAITLSHDGQTAYVTNEIDNSLSVIDLATQTVTSFFVGEQPLGIALTPDGDFAYIALGSGSVAVVSTNPLKLVGTPIEVGGNPQSIAIPPGVPLTPVHVKFGLGGVLQKEVIILGEGGVMEVIPGDAPGPPLVINTNPGAEGQQGAEGTRSSDEER